LLALLTALFLTPWAVREKNKQWPAKQEPQVTLREYMEQEAGVSLYRVLKHSAGEMWEDITKTNSVEKTQ
jgi:hypothetical protein